MADDMHIERLIREAEEAACKPMALMDLKPHERAIAFSWTPVPNAS